MAVDTHDGFDAEAFEEFLVELENAYAEQGLRVRLSVEDRIEAIGAQIRFGLMGAWREGLDPLDALRPLLASTPDELLVFDTVRSGRSLITKPVAHARVPAQERLQTAQRASAGRASGLPFRIDWRWQAIAALFAFVFLILLLAVALINYQNLLDKAAPAYASVASFVASALAAIFGSVNNVWAATLLVMPWVASLAWALYRFARPLDIRLLRRQLSLNAERLDYESASVNAPLDRRTARRLAADMSRRVDRGHDELNLERSIELAVRNGGFFRPVMQPRLQAAEFVAVIHRRSKDDLQHERTSRLLAFLRAQGLTVAAYSYWPDPRFCAALDPRSGLSESVVALSSLVEAHANAALLVFSDGDDFFEASSLALSGWTEALARWRLKILITSRAPALWGARERAIKRALKCPVAEDTPREIARAIELASQPHAPPKAPVVLEEPGFGFGREQKLLSELRPSTATWKALETELIRTLGSLGMDWLSACAAYPEHRWDIASYFGQTLKRRIGVNPEAPIYSDDGMKQLAALPWFRQGWMPDWLRERLLKRLDRERRREIRLALAELLQTAKPVQREARSTSHVGLRFYWRPLRAPATNAPVSDRLTLDFLRRGEIRAVAPKLPASLLTDLASQRIDLWSRTTSEAAIVSALGLAVTLFFIQQIAQLAWFWVAVLATAAIAAAVALHIWRPTFIARRRVTKPEAPDSSSRRVGSASTLKIDFNAIPLAPIETIDPFILSRDDVQRIQLSANGAKLAVIGENELRIYDTVPRGGYSSKPRKDLTCAALSADGTDYVVGTSTGLLSFGAVKSLAEEPVYPAAASAINEVAFTDRPGQAWYATRYALGVASSEGIRVVHRHNGRKWRFLNNGAIAVSDISARASVMVSRNGAEAVCDDGRLSALGEGHAITLRGSDLHLRKWTREFAPLVTIQNLPGQVAHASIHNGNAHLILDVRPLIRVDVLGYASGAPRLFATLLNVGKADAISASDDCQTLASMTFHADVQIWSTLSADPRRSERAPRRVYIVGGDANDRVLRRYERALRDVGLSVWVEARMGPSKVSLEASSLVLAYPTHDQSRMESFELAFERHKSVVSIDVRTRTPHAFARLAVQTIEDLARRARQELKEQARAWSASGRDRTLLMEPRKAIERSIAAGYDIAADVDPLISAFLLASRTDDSSTRPGPTVIGALNHVAPGLGDALNPRSLSEIAPAGDWRLTGEALLNRMIETLAQAYGRREGMSGADVIAGIGELARSGLNAVPRDRGAMRAGAQAGLISRDGQGVRRFSHRAIEAWFTAYNVANDFERYDAQSLARLDLIADPLLGRLLTERLARIHARCLSDNASADLSWVDHAGYRRFLDFTKWRKGIGQGLHPSLRDGATPSSLPFFGPESSFQRRGAPNALAHSISWFDALQFCRMSGAKLPHASSKLPRRDPEVHYAWSHGWFSQEDTFVNLITNNEAHGRLGANPDFRATGIGLAVVRLGRD